METVARHSAAVEQRWLGIVAVAVPFGTIIACDTYVIQNSYISVITNYQKRDAEGTRTRRASSS